MSTDSTTTTAPQSTDRTHQAGRVPDSTLPTADIPLAPDEQRAYLVEVHAVDTPTGREYHAVYATVSGKWAVRAVADPHEALPATMPIDRNAGTRVPWSARQRFNQRIRRLHLSGGEQA